jgi:hypothetical protein
MHLKRKVFADWLRQKDPSECILYLGFDWTEPHRLESARKGYAKHVGPYRVEAPMMDPPLLSKGQMLDMMRAEGLEPPRLYEMGFPHNNCGGFCTKAGQAHFRLLLEQMPERYAHHEAQEESARQYLGKDVSILRDRTGGVTKPLTLRALRERIQGGAQCDLFDWGGCGCFV